ncbi:hypothetical protein ANN_12304 [Periplaneta americana]|uniref:Ionotropic glutamate receptor C-terminal domain-containing protein n=1 Tax=Periplaneta americana TaxID=6978 RepID=A0ABQ8TIP0_PERAM|nr:hypothetical protein ANN_12304 [Periplaneta americana]
MRCGFFGLAIILIATAHDLQLECRRSLPNIARVVAAVQRHYHSNCIFLIALSKNSDPDLEEVTMLTDIGKHLSKKGVSNAIVRAEIYNYSLDAFQCPRNRPLNVILSTNKTNNSSLHQVSSFMGPVWLMFTDSMQQLHNLFLNVYISLDTEFLLAHSDANDRVTLYESYRIMTDTPYVWHVFGNWTAADGLSAPHLSVYDRRRNLQNSVFQATVTENPPMTVLEKNETSLIINGFVGKVWSTMQQDLNFSYSVLIRKPDQQEVDWDTFLTPFSRGVWLTTVVFLVVVALSLHVIGIYGSDAPFTFNNSLFYVYGLLCQQENVSLSGTDKSPQSFSCQLVFTTACVTAVVLLANYSATLISFLTIRHDRLPFKDLAGLLADGTYQFGTVKNSAEYFYYKTANDSFVRKLYRETMANDEANFPATKPEGLQRVCSSKYGFYMQHDSAVMFSKNLSCSVVRLPREDSVVSVSLVLNKASPYRNLFSHRQVCMMEETILRSMGTLNVDDYSPVALISGSQSRCRSAIFKRVRLVIR